MLFYRKQDIQDYSSTFNILYRKYRFLMMRVAFNILQDRYLAEDAVQDAFFRASQSINELSDVGALKTKRFLAMLARNAAIDIYRRRGRQMEREVPIDELEESEEPVANIETDMENGVLDVLKNLPDKYRDVFLLKYSSKLENREIAKLLGIPEGSVRQRVARGKVLVQDALRAMEGRNDETYGCDR